MTGGAVFEKKSRNRQIKGIVNLMPLQNRQPPLKRRFMTAENLVNTPFCKISLAVRDIQGMKTVIVANKTLTFKVLTSK